MGAFSSKDLDAANQELAAVKSKLKQLEGRSADGSQKTISDLKAQLDDQRQQMQQQEQALAEKLTAAAQELEAVKKQAAADLVMWNKVVLGQMTERNSVESKIVAAERDRDMAFAQRQIAERLATEQVQENTEVTSELSEARQLLQPMKQSQLQYSLWLPHLQQCANSLTLLSNRSMVRFGYKPGTNGQDARLAAAYAHSFTDSVAGAASCLWSPDLKEIKDMQVGAQLLTRHANFSTSLNASGDLGLVAALAPRAGVVLQVGAGLDANKMFSTPRIKTHVTLQLNQLFGDSH